MLILVYVEKLSFLANHNLLKSIFWTLFVRTSLLHRHLVLKTHYLDIGYGVLFLFLTLVLAPDITGFTFVFALLTSILTSGGDITVYLLGHFVRVEVWQF